MEIKKWLNTTLSRRDAVTGTAKIGAAVALSNAITLPFSTTAQAKRLTLLRKAEMAKPFATVPAWSTVAAVAR